MNVHVEMRDIARGNIEPVSFTMGARAVQVLAVLDRWLAQEHSYFKIEASDGDVYILRYAAPDGTWELTWFQSPAAP